MNDHTRHSQQASECPSNGDLVNHPAHYTTRRMEAIDIIEVAIEDQHDPVMGYLMSNVIKYLLRYQYKGTPEQDLKKASWYLQRMIGKLDGQE